MIPGTVQHAPKLCFWPSFSRPYRRDTKGFAMKQLHQGLDYTLDKIYIRKAKRWQGVAVYVGPEGIGVQRQSKGTNMWLYDLWLAEYLIDRIHAS
jgi:hypothetical protein